MCVWRGVPWYPTFGFHQKCYFSYRLHGMVLWLMHINQLNTPYKKLSAEILIWGHLRSQGSKGHFHQKCSFSYRLHGIVLWLMHIHQLDTPTKVIGSNLNLGSFGVTGVKMSFSPKMLFLLQIAWYGPVTDTYSSARYPYKSYWLKFKFGVISGHWGQMVIFTKNAITPPYCIAWP